MKNNKIQPKNSLKKQDKKEFLSSFLLKEFDNSGHIANHFGFMPISVPKSDKTDESLSKNFKDLDNFKNESLDKVSILRFFNETLSPSIQIPAMLYFEKHSNPEQINTKLKGYSSCSLEIIGSNKPLSEAILIKTALSILSEYGNKNLSLDVNFVGEKESFTKFEREINSYLKKNINDIPSEYKQKFKEKPILILDLTDKDFAKYEKLIEVYRNAPKPMNCLSEQSREHFKEVLEFLESFGVPYRIRHSLVPNKHYGSHTIFQIFETIETKSGEENILMAYGGRYNYLAKKIGHKKDIPCFGSIIFYKKIKGEKKYHIDKIPKPKFYLVQLGNFAKMKILNILEDLRKEKIPVYHSLTKEKITGQINSAEYLKVSHLLIIGQKEAIEGSVVVRSIEVRDQQNVYMKDLPLHLKNIIKSKPEREKIKKNTKTRK
jgi:histidyl-tRNA synthetase